MSTKEEKKKKSDPTEYDWRLLIMVGVLAITFTLFVGVTINNLNNAKDRLNKIENSDMFIHTAEYEEVCSKWETQEVNEIIYPKDKNNCDRFCDIAEDIKLVSTTDNDWIIAITYGDEAFDSLIKNGIYIYETTEACIYCLNQTEPYIHTTEITSCTEWILVKKQLGDKYEK